jgi:hypothetical protein
MYAGDANRAAQGSKLPFCRPKGVTREQAIRMVVAYIDNQPERSRERFLFLAFEAMMKTWPCT